MTLCPIYALFSSIILLTSSTSIPAIAESPTTSSITSAVAKTTISEQVTATTTISSSLNINDSNNLNTHHIKQSPSSLLPTTIQKPEFASIDNRNTSHNNNNGDNFGSGIAGYLLAEASDEKLNKSNTLDATLASILGRTGPDMRPLRDFEDFDDITVDVARRAWQLMHEHAQSALVSRFKLVGPLVERVLKSANLSDKCIDAALNTMKAAQQLDSWAIQRKFNKLLQYSLHFCTCSLLFPKARVKFCIFSTSL